MSVKLFISQAMTGRKESEVRHERWFYYTLAKLMWGYDLELINQFDAPDDMPTFEGSTTKERETKQSLWLLGRSIQMMKDADIVIMVGNPIESKGMMVEYEVLRQYNWRFHTDKDMIEWVKKNKPREFIDIMNTCVSYGLNINDELVVKEDKSKEETLSDNADKPVEAIQEKSKTDEGSISEHLDGLKSKWKADYTPSQVTRFEVQNSSPFRAFFREALTTLNEESKIPLTFNAPVDIHDTTMELPGVAICGWITEILYDVNRQNFYVDAEIKTYNKSLIKQILKDIVVVPWMVGKGESVDWLVAFTISARSAYNKNN